MLFGHKISVGFAHAYRLIDVNTNSIHATFCVTTYQMDHKYFGFLQNTDLLER